VSLVNAELTKELSMIEVAYYLMNQQEKVTLFTDLVKNIQQILEISEEELAERLSQFYTDLNIDGRFIFLGETGWGLRSWYPYEQIDEEVIVATKSRKKKDKKKVEDDFDDVEELFEEENDIDELEEESVDEEGFLEDDLLEEEDELFEEDELEEEEEEL